VGYSLYPFSKSWGAFYVVKRASIIVRVESLLHGKYYLLCGSIYLLFSSWWRLWKLYISGGRAFSQSGCILVSKGPSSCFFQVKLDNIIENSCIQTAHLWESTHIFLLGLIFLSKTNYGNKDTFPLWGDYIYCNKDSFGLTLQQHYLYNK
jgi:hypothetical protein